MAGKILTPEQIAQLKAQKAAKAAPAAPAAAAPLKRPSAPPAAKPAERKSSKPPRLPPPPFPSPALAHVQAQAQAVEAAPVQPVPGAPVQPVQATSVQPVQPPPAQPFQPAVDQDAITRVQDPDDAATREMATRVIPPSQPAPAQREQTLATGVDPSKRFPGAPNVPADMAAVAAPAVAAQPTQSQPAAQAAPTKEIPVETSPDAVTALGEGRTITYGGEVGNLKTFTVKGPNFKGEMIALSPGQSRDVPEGKLSVVHNADGTVKAVVEAAAQAPSVPQAPQASDEPKPVRIDQEPNKTVDLGDGYSVTFKGVMKGMGAVVAFKVPGLEDNVILPENGEKTVEGSDGATLTISNRGIAAGVYAEKALQELEPEETTGEKIKNALGTVGYYKNEIVTALGVAAATTIVATFQWVEQLVGSTTQGIVAAAVGVLGTASVAVAFRKRRKERGAQEN